MKKKPVIFGLTEDELNPNLLSLEPIDRIDERGLSDAEKTEVRKIIDGWNAMTRANRHRFLIGIGIPANLVSKPKRDERT